MIGRGAVYPSARRQAWPRLGALKTLATTAIVHPSCFVTSRGLLASFFKSPIGVRFSAKNPHYCLYAAGENSRRESPIGRKGAYFVYRSNGFLSSDREDAFFSFLAFKGASLAN